MYLNNLVNGFLKYDPATPMLFNSSAFFISFILFLSIYTVIYQKSKWMISLWVIGYSLFFYYKSSGIYFVLLLVTAVIDYYGAFLIRQMSDKFSQRVILFWLLVLHFGLLGYFKYTHFIIFNLQMILQKNFALQEIFLPVGISFYTFQSVSYVLDVYQKKLSPTHNFLDYLFFLSYFPQLVAGPIVKANHFLPQLETTILISRNKVWQGLWLIMLGLIKKSVIADYISQFNDLVFNNPLGYSGFENLMAIYGYTLQIYCDFCGYSDMAIGLGKMMGFDLGQNFRFPYQALNITDFWRRWHISLSTWLRDYLYIPLGGNKKGKIRTYINLMITMLLGGLWHGAAWRFVFWGGVHGMGLALHKALSPLLDKIPSGRWVRGISWLLTFHFVIFLWIFFRAGDIAIYPIVAEQVDLQPQIINGYRVAWMMIDRVLNQFDFFYIIPFWKARKLWLFLLTIGFAMHFTPEHLWKKWQKRFPRYSWGVKFLVFLFVAQLVIQFSGQSVQPFIYFQF